MKKIMLILLLTLTVTSRGLSLSVFEVDGKTIFPPNLAVTSGGTLTLRVVSPSAPLTKDTLALIQFSGCVGVPLPVTISVTPEASSVIFMVSVRLPEVKNITSTFLENIDPKTIGWKLPVTIYPVEDKTATGKSLNQKMRGNGKRLAVSGADYQLNNFLKARQIDFESVVFPPVDYDPDTLYLVCTPARSASVLHALPPGLKSRVIYFIRYDDAFTQSGLFTELSVSGGVVVKAPCTIIDDLETNPRHREIFLNLLNQNLSRIWTVEN